LAERHDYDDSFADVAPRNIVLHRRLLLTVHFLSIEADDYLLRKGGLKARIDH
jgi:hypothetical protein